MMTRLDDGTPVHAGGRAAFNMLDLVRELHGYRKEERTRAAIGVRIRYPPSYGNHD